MYRSIKVFLTAVAALAMLLTINRVQAQTYVSAPLSSSTLPPGQYYSNSSISLSAGFSASGSTGAYSFYINGDCSPLSTAPSSTQNYIMTSVPRIPGYVPGAAGYTSCDVMQTIQYIDGIGRPIQTVQVKGSALNSDMVAPNAYDEFNREAVKYLPYAYQGTANGSFKTDALSSSTTSQYGFYNAPPTGTGVGQITVATAQTNYEPSPLNRVAEQGAPGAAWQPVAGSTAGHTVKLAYTNNNTIALTDTIHTYLAALYRANINSDLSRTLINSGTYNAGQLNVTISKDENWSTGRAGTMETYTDKEGHIVLKRTFNFTSGSIQILSTYYVYDDLGELAFVLTPMSNADSVTPTQATLDNLCYQYRYDLRNRQVEKKIPGKGWEFIVYNTLDQVVMTQDANQRNNSPQQWTFTKYDAIGRTIVTGIWTYGGSSADNSMSTPSIAELTWLQNFYTTTTNPKWETFTGTTTTGYDGLSDPGGQTYTNYTINYFDSYPGSSYVPAVYAAPTGASTMTRGLSTASLTNILSTTSMLASVHYYDALGRLVQAYRQHYYNAAVSNSNYDLLANTYNFSNQVVTTNRQHFNSTNTSTPIVTVANTYNYDHVGRKIQTLEQINSGTAVMLNKIDFNEIGQVKTKHLHSVNSGSSFFQDIPYIYNERGWLLSSGAALFQEQLQYNTGANKQYNGNIAYQNWSSAANTTTNTYTYIMIS